MRGFRAVARTDVGRQRDRNEDFALETGLRAGSHLLAVADGMGGHAAGEVASVTGLKAFHDRINEGVKGGSAESSARELLEDAVAAANGAVREAAGADPDTEGMGTTLVAAVVMGETALVVNVGDSRAYLVDAGARPGIEQVTVDHSMAQRMVEEGDLSPAEAADHPNRHVLSQALGASETVHPEFFEASLSDATLLLCSDGLTEEVPDGEIAAVVADATDLAAAAETLIDRANEGGGSDNVSVVLGRWE